MATEIEVIIKGLALCFRDSHQQWNVIFVCDPKHPLKLSHPHGGPDPELRVDGQDFTCVFSGDITPRPGSAFPNALFNLNGRQAHDGRLRFLKRDHGLETQVVAMILPSATLAVHEATGVDYFIQEVGAGSPPEQIGPVAKRLRFSFLLNSGPLNVRVGNRQQEIFNVDFPDTGGKRTFRFNNHCDGSCRRNDSLDMYDIMIDGEPDAERRFVTGAKDATGNIPGHDSTMPSFSKEMQLLTVPYGNCDPMGSEPPPG
ncbi:MAG TPA: hypothetical protein VJV05_09275 [Pyrinomonadaceae bacterium]|nr:hypothetical protein [Pyrinomonadaceae bacterium]